MSARRQTWWTALLLAAGLAPAPAQEATPERVVAIKAGKLLTMNAQDEVLDGAVIVLRGEKIAAVGPADRVEIPAGAEVIDASSAWVLPGFVDCHDHVAGSLGDLNDGVWLTNPGLRTVDTLLPENENLKNALAGGVTAVCLIPGSGNNMSGFGTITRTAGATVEEMTIRAPGSLKIAQAGNPEGYWFGVGRAYMNWNLGQTLDKALAYHRTWEEWERAVRERGETGAGPAPQRDPIWEDFRPLFRKEIPVTVHTQIYQVVMKTLVQLHDKYGLEVVLDHSTFDGYKTAPLALERPRVFTICGPRQFFFDRSERRILGVAERWSAAGQKQLGINTDAPVVPQEELTLQAALGCRFGLDHYTALKGLTIVPARALKVDALIGSLEPGKEADLAIWTGDPLDPRSACLRTVVRGRTAYDQTKDRRF